jgi:CO/xanthine dehydrogenase Mo-binding subunit
MNKMLVTNGWDRRAFLAASGALVVAAGASGLYSKSALAEVSETRPPFTPDQLDSWLSIDKAGNVTAYFGKIDVGQGVDVSVSQIIAEELDVSLQSVKIIMGNSDLTIDHGGTTADSGVREGGALMRSIAAEARRLLLEMASKQLGVEPSAVHASNGIVSVAADPSKTVSYAELVGGRYFNTKVEWNKKTAATLRVKGKAKPKVASEYKIVGKSMPRTDIAPKVFGKFEYVSDVRLPGMLHGRMIRPSVAGAVPTAVDENSIKEIKGARAVWIKDFLGVVADKEWDAVRAAKALKVTWSDVKPPFPKQAELHDHIRAAQVTKREIEVENGSVETAFADAAKQGLRVVEAEYEWPFQSHASMGPAVSVVDVTPQHVTIYTGTQKPYAARDGIAKLLGRDRKDVSAIWVAGTGSYGRNDAGDASADAAVLSNAVGKPVRVQYSRAEGLAWDPKGSASIHRVRAAIDSSGKVVAHDFMTKGFSLRDMSPREDSPAYVLAGHQLGFALDPIKYFGIPTDTYGFDHKRVGWECVPPLLDRVSPLRTSHVRATASPMCHFASEQFIDELALFTATDPVEFRLRYMTSQRDKDVVQKAADIAGWDHRVGPRKDQQGQEVMRGRGIGMSSKEGTSVAIVVEVEVHAPTGLVRPTKFFVAHDCGLIINPQGLRQVIECQTVWAASRAICEEVKFNESMVTSNDWMSYSTSDIALAPDVFEIAMINRPEIPAAGAGEGTARSVAGAVANAFFDATGVRIRRAPLSPEHIKAALTRT